MIKRLRDQSADIRLLCLTKLLTLAQHDPHLLSLSTYIEIGERAKDKKVDIRRLAVKGLCKIYGKYIAERVAESENFKSIAPLVLDSYHTQSDLVNKLSFVPSLLMKYWGYPDIADKHIVIQSLQEYLLPKVHHVETDSFSGGGSYNASQSSTNSKTIPNSAVIAQQVNIDEKRSNALLILFQHFSPSDQQTFSQILGFKLRVRSELASFLKAKSLSGSEGRRRCGY
jgi:hypothetical protein